MLYWNCRFEFHSRGRDDRKTMKWLTVDEAKRYGDNMKRQVHLL